MSEKRKTTVKTALGPDVLIFSSLDGRDEISSCFEFSVNLLTLENEVDPYKIVGTDMTIETIGEDTEVRFFHGYVSDFSLVNIEYIEQQDQTRYHYEATIRPWLWFLGKTTDCRIFQNMSVVEIVESVLGEAPNNDFKVDLKNSYDPREYTVQYDESDLAFVQRLLEHEGIFYYFEYDDGAHTMVLTDDNSKLKTAKGNEVMPFRPEGSLLPELYDYLDMFAPSHSATVGSYVHTDYDFTAPGTDLMATSVDPLAHALADGEIYSNPGTHLSVSAGERYAGIRREELQATHMIAHASGMARGLGSGKIFKLEDYPRIDRPSRSHNTDYIVTACTYSLFDPEYRVGPEPGSNRFTIMLRLQPLALPFRPARVTPRPIMRGPQTAVVVGPAGEEIYTDEYSRVKVQFHWDRLGGKDENSTCFIRVSSVWAGSGWGFIQIPRIGQEVIVDFIEGNPDHPIITGRVYNEFQMPAHSLPDNATISGWRSQSSPGGGGFNELYFEDKAGEELVYFQAQKDHTEWIKNDETRNIDHDMFEEVGNDSEQIIGHDRTELVKNDKFTTVDMNRTVKIGVDDTEEVGNMRSLTVGVNETINIGANSTETIGANHSQTVVANQTVAVGAAQAVTVAAAAAMTVGGAQAVTIGKERAVTVASDQSTNVGGDDSTGVGGAQSLSVGKDRSVSVGKNQSISVAENQSTSVGKDMSVSVGKNFTLEAEDSITLKCGKASITLKKDGTITSDGKDLNFKASGKVNVKASSDVILKGSNVKAN